MTWLRTDDVDWCAPWVMVAGNAAYGAYQRLAGYCAQNSTDGHVPAEVASLIAPLTGSDARDRLVDAGRIEARSDGSLYLPRFLDNNPSQAQTEAKREARSAAGSKGGKRSGVTRRNGAG